MATSSDDRVSATRVIEAPAEAIFAVLADPSSHTAIDGTGLHAVTGSQALAEHPSWSPDGRTLAFTLLPRRLPMRGVLAQQVYLVGANGHGLRRLTSRQAGAGEAAWSPDGRRIAFSAPRSMADNIDERMRR